MNFYCKLIIFYYVLYILKCSCDLSLYTIIKLFHVIMLHNENTQEMFIDKHNMLYFVL